MASLVLSCSDHSIREAAGLIREGKLVVYPTDTLYGLGCNALDEDAISAVFDVKKRDRGKPLSVTVCNLKMLRKYAVFDERAMRVMEPFLPSPVTFLVKKRMLPDSLTGGSDKVGVRIPEDRTALKLVMEAGVPIVATSANISGRPSSETVEEALAQLPAVDLFLDSGRRSGLPSTIVDLTLDPPEIVREGKKSSWEILRVIQEVYFPGGD